MIDLYTAPTPNGWKVSVFLEEAELPYRVHWIDIGKGDQLAPDFQAISPNNKIPAVVDNAPLNGGRAISVFETGAILVYLAEKCARFIPQDARGRVAALQWLFWQTGGLGPMMGQHGHFKLYAPERIAYATDRYRRETLRLFGVLDRRLAMHRFLAGDEYSIADMACFPWVQTYRAQEISLPDFVHVSAWYEALKERPGLRRGMAVGREFIKQVPQNDIQARKILFGI